MGASLSKRYNICWNCKNPATNLECSTCTRVFHSGCLQPDDEAAKENWICVICTKLKSLKNTKNKKEDIAALPILMSHVVNSEMFKKLENSMKNANQLKPEIVLLVTTAIDLAKDKELGNHFKSLDAFLADVQWILNNYSTLFPDGNMHAVKPFNELFNNECESLRECAECYRNASTNPDSWFTMVCDEPHIIVWAIKNIVSKSYWPAKLMAIDGQRVIVRFSPRGQRAVVPAADCVLFTENRPGRRHRRESDGQPIIFFDDAMLNINSYIENIRKKFGSFVYANDAVFNPASLNRYVMKMIPGIAQFREANGLNTRIPKPIVVKVEPNNISESNPMPGEDGHDEPEIGDLTLPDETNNVTAPKSKARESTSNDDAEVPMKKSRLVSENVEQPIGSQIDADRKSTIASEGSGNTVNMRDVLYESLRDSADKILAAQIDELKCEKDRAKELEKKNHQMERELAIVKAEIEDTIKRMTAERDAAVAETMEQCKMKCSINKKMKFCHSCDTGKLLDMFFCDDNCADRYRKQGDS